MSQEESRGAAGPKDSYARRLQLALSHAQRRRQGPSAPAETPAEPRNGEPGAPACDADLEALVRAWPSLGAPVKAALLAVVHGCQESASGNRGR